MEFKIKTQSEIQKMSETEADVYFTAKAENDTLVMKKAITDAVEPLELKLKETTENLETTALSLKDLKEKGTQENQTFKSILAEVIEAKKDDFLKLKENRSGSIQLTIKAVGSMSLVGNTIGQIPQAEREAGITRIQRRQPFVLELVNVGTITSNLWEWVEQKNPEGDAGMTAEGAKKSQVDFDLVTGSAKVQKVTAFIKVTKEMLDDVALLRSEINQELTELINLKIDEQLLTGTGIGDNLVGLNVNASVFTAGSFALAVQTPNNADVLRVAINQVMLADFMVTDILLNSNEATQMDLDKGSDGHYLTRPFTNSDGTVVNGIPVTINNGVAPGTFLLGDFTKAGVRFKEALTINVGYENDDFTKNFVTILAEARLVQRVKSNHYKAFVKGTFSTARTAITKP